MSCNHKFQEDLNVNGLNFKPSTLIVGTFNPSWPEGNNSKWFYGRTHDAYNNINNNFWDVLPRLYNEASLINGVPADWKEFCKRHKIALTDLIFSIEDAEQNNPSHVSALENYSDQMIATKFKRYQLTDIDNILQQHPDITNVYLTNGANGAFWRNTWKSIEKGQHRRFTKLMTPSRYARHGMFKYNTIHPHNLFTMARLNDYILMMWKNQWHF